jgi:hypothetical protein
VEAEKQGKQVIYRLKRSVLEDALLGFAKAFGLSLQPEKEATDRSEEEETPS